jgi:hypothetical protein
MRSRYLQMKVKIGSMTITGHESGKTTLRKTVNSPAPFSLAASISSLGMLTMNCRTIKSLKASAARGMRTPHQVLTQPVNVPLRSGALCARRFRGL